jgi:hypothetical protein
MPELAWQLYITGKHKMGRYISTGATQANTCTLVGTSVCYQVNCQKYAYDGNSCWQNRVIIDTPGSYTFTVPAGVTCLRTIAVGGGGKSSYTASSTTNYAGAGGGYVEKVDTVVAGCTVTVVVGRQQQDTTISYVCAGGATRTLTAGGATCCNPGTASGGDWNSIGGTGGCAYSGGNAPGIYNQTTTDSCCGYCVVYHGYGVYTGNDNSPGSTSGKAPGGGSAGSWIHSCGGQGGGANYEDVVVGGGYGPAAGGGGGIGYICKMTVVPAPCSCICTNQRCNDGYPGGMKSHYMSGTSGGGGTKFQRCDTGIGRQFGFRGMCVSGQFHYGAGGWGGYDNDEGRDTRFIWYHRSCMGSIGQWQEHGPQPKRYEWHDIHSMCGSGSQGNGLNDAACYRTCSNWNQGPTLAQNAWHNAGEGAGTGGVAYFCCEPTSMNIPNCMGGAACRIGINWNLLCCLGTTGRICCADKMQDQLFPYVTHCAGTLGGSGGVDIMWMASRAGKGGGAGQNRCYLLCVCWGGSYNNCNGGGTPLAFPPCKLDQLASTAGTGMAVIYWKNS